MFQPNNAHVSPPASGFVFDCASSFASVALVQMAGGETLCGRLHRCIQRLIERRTVR